MYGLLDLSFWGYVIALMVLTQITIASVTLYLHRCQAHKAIDLHPIVSHFFRLWLWLTTGQHTKAWAAIHRKHHARCETPDDPHSPQILGLSKVLREGAELYQAEAKNEETLRKYGHGTPEDWIERHVYTPYTYYGVVLMLFIDLALFGVPGLTIWAVQMMWIPIFAAGVINGVGHFWGYRNFECPDAATNITPIGFFIGGEELHNNHHTYATSAKFSVKWYEFDIGWMYIRLLSFIKLARVHRVPPKMKCLPQIRPIDFDALNAVIQNRFQLMANYSREVMLPIFKAEREKAGEQMRTMIKNARRGLFRDQRLLKPHDIERLQNAIRNNDMLRTVHEFRERLQLLWQSRASKEDLTHALQKWCAEAEATGIRALAEFAQQIRMLSPQMA